MKKILGITGLLLFIMFLCTVYGDNFWSPENVVNQLRRIGLFSFIGIGVCFVIITGGIDLSIGWVVGLLGILLPWLLIEKGWYSYEAVPFVIIISMLIGLAHGLLITKVRIQPFIVTLCGLLIYRGLARGIAGGNNQGYKGEHPGLQEVVSGNIEIGSYYIPYPFLYMLVVAIIAMIFLNRTIYGRYLLALGRNTEASRLTGIRTDRMIIMSYVICSTMAGLGAILFSLEYAPVQAASHGEFYELYAIAAAVLGGCSLRGGEGTILGVVIGTAVIQLLRNAIILMGIPDQLEFAVIGIVILIGVIADEFAKRLAIKRRALRQATSG